MSPLNSFLANSHPSDSTKTILGPNLENDVLLQKFLKENGHQQNFIFFYGLEKID